MPQPSRAPLAPFLRSVPLLLLAASPVAAQTGDGTFQMLGRIILGTGTAKVAIDTPQAVTTLGSADLARDQPQGITDLFKAVPGIQGTGASARPLGQAFNIRGIGSFDQVASEARIIVTVDGAPKFYESYRMGSFFGDLDLYKQVEVLRGPASSTLYGSGAIGGAVTFTTRDASDFLMGNERQVFRFSSSFESNGGGTGIGILSATRAGGAEYLAALNLGRNGDKADGSGAIIPGTAYEAASGLLKGKWTFGDDDAQSLTLSYSRTDTDLARTPVIQTGGTAAALSGFGLHDLRAVDDTLTLAWRNTYPDNPLLDLTMQLSQTRTAVSKSNFTLAGCAPGQSQVLCPSDYGYDTTTLKIENTASLGAGAWENHLTLGLQASDQRRSATSSLGSLAFHPEGTDRKLAAYLQGEFTYGDRLTIIPGIRADFGTLTPGAAAQALGGSAQRDVAVSPKIAAMVDITPGLSLFGSLARTERMPTLDELFSTEPASAGPRGGAERVASLDLRKERAETVELGVTLTRDGLITEGDSFQMKATAYRSNLTDLIATTLRPAFGQPAVPYFTNIAAAEIWGSEIEAAYDSDRWFAQLAYSDVKSRNAATGLTLQDTPAETVVLTVGAKLPQQGLTLGWRASHFDSIVTAAAATTAPSYDTHDLFVTWAPDAGALAGLEVNLTVENVFDSLYRNNLSLDPAPGRTAKLSIAKRIAF